MNLRMPALLLALSAGFSPAAEARVEIISAEFGIFDNTNPDELAFEPGRVVPHQTGQRYGWIIEIRTDQRSVGVSEEYLLSPTSPDVQKSSDPSNADLSIAQQRRNQVSQRQLVPVDGRIYGEWSVGPGEPAGHRHLRVLVEGQTAASFEYDVK